jgi:GntR family transcriptional regulator
MFELPPQRDGGPIHVAIATRIEAAIDSGELATGTRLPPERELAGSFGVSRMTVRQALGSLERDGLLRRVVGRSGGTFVQERKVERRPAKLAGLSAELRRQGMAAGARVVLVEVRPAGRRTAAALALAPGDPIVVVVRIRLADGKPLALERSSVPARLFPGLESLDLAGSLYETMRDAFDLKPVRAVERLEPVPARPADARALGVRRGTALMLVERVAYAEDGTPLEFARDRFRGDRTRIVIESTEVEE